MITIEQIRALRERVETLDRCLSIGQKREEVKEKTEKTLAPDFWNDPKEAEKFLKELAGVKFWVNGYDRVASGVSDLEVLYDFAKESMDGAEEGVETEEAKELDRSYMAVEKDIEELELRNMLGEEGDSLGAILTINSGAGGTEANDWSAMLMRMYMRRHQVGDNPVRGRLCLRIPQGRERSPPSCTYFSVQCSGQTPDDILVRVCLSACG